MLSIFENDIIGINEVLIFECSSPNSCALMHEPVLFTDVHTSVQVHALMHMYCTIIKSHMS